MRGETVSAWKCCGERTCQREQPIRVVRSVQDGRWYVITAYAERAGGAIEVQQKHLVHPADERQLEDAHQTALSHNAGKRAIVDVGLPDDLEPLGVFQLQGDTTRRLDTITPANAGDTTYRVHPERLDPDDTGELVICRHCGQELHQGRGNMLRGPDDKSVCAAFEPPAALFHEPVRPPS